VEVFCSEGYRAVKVLPLEISHLEKNLWPPPCDRWLLRRAAPRLCQTPRVLRTQSDEKTRETFSYKFRASFNFTSRLNAAARQVDLLDETYRPVAKCGDPTSFMAKCEASARAAFDHASPVSGNGLPHRHKLGSKLGRFFVRRLTRLVETRTQAHKCSYDSGGMRCVRVVCNLGDEPRLDFDITTQEQFVYAGETAMLNCSHGARHGSHDPSAPRDGISICQTDCKLNLQVSPNLVRDA